MKSLFRSLYLDHTPGVRLLLAIFGISFLFAEILLLARFNAYAWLGLNPGAVLQGQVWRVATYGFIPAGILDFLFGVIWFSVLGGQLERVWRGRTFWACCLVSAVGAAVPVLLMLSELRCALVGSAPVTFGLLVAWYRLCGHEELILHGLGRMNVRQAVVIIGFLNGVFVYVSSGWKITLCLLCGGVASWLYLSFQQRINWLRPRGPVGPGRMNRLEV